MLPKEPLGLTRLLPEELIDFIALTFSGNGRGKRNTSVCFLAVHFLGALAADISNQAFLKQFLMTSFTVTFHKAESI